MQLIKVFLKSIYFNFIFLPIVTNINETVLDDTSTVYTFSKNMYGCNNKFKHLIIQKFEFYEDVEFFSFSNAFMQSFLLFCYSIFPPKNSIKDIDLNNIYMLHFLTTYKGWRHSKGLPVRGQRTWTNAWSCYRNNTILRNYRKEESKYYYVSAPLKESFLAFEAEYVNIFWKIQFSDEWFSARRELLRFNGHPSTMKIELFMMANYQVMFPEKLKNMSKKKKQAHSKNSFSLGFDVGFTQSMMAEKFNIKELVSNENAYSGSKLIFRDERPLHKKKKSVFRKVVKKVQDVKKKKKSVWD